MNEVSLPARIAYALLAVPLGGAVGFYSIMLLFPKLVAVLPRLDPGGLQLDMGADGFAVFKLAVGTAAALAFTAALLALTLPWKRHRKRRGRPGRIAVSCVVVMIASVAFASQIHSLLYDLIFAAWLTYTLAFSYVRYGVLDQTRRATAATEG